MWGMYEMDIRHNLFTLAISFETTETFGYGV